MHKTEEHIFNAWQQAQRQSPAAIFIILLKAILRLLKGFWPVLLLYLIPRTPKEDELDAAAQASHFDWLSWFPVFLLGLALFIAIFRYWFYRFSIDKGHLEIQSGFIRQNQLSIPLKNIQAVHLEQGIWQRLLGVYRVSFDSIGSKGAEVQIDALPKQKAQELKDFLMKNKPSNLTESDGSILVKENNTSNPKINYRLDAGDLLKLSLSANHLEAFMLLALFVFQLIDDIEPILQRGQKATIEQYAQSAEQMLVSAIVILLIVTVIVSILISAGRTLIKYYDFRFAQEGKDWRLNFGLFTRHQRFTPISKIQMINYKANWLRRKINLWLMTLHTIGQEAKNIEVKLNLPVTSRLQAEALASYYLDVRLFDKIDKEGISPLYWQRASIWFTLIAIAITISIVWWFHWAWSLIPLSIWLYSVWHFYQWQQSFRWAIVSQGLWCRSGVWGRRYELLRWEKIQQVEFRQSLYQRQNGLASLNLITAGGEVYLPFLPQTIAHKINDYALYRLESQTANWL